MAVWSAIPKVFAGMLLCLFALTPVRQTTPELEEHNFFTNQQLTEVALPPYSLQLSLIGLALAGTGLYELLSTGKSSEKLEQKIRQAKARRRRSEQIGQEEQALATLAYLVQQQAIAEPEGLALPSTEQQPLQFPLNLREPELEAIALTPEPQAASRQLHQDPSQLPAQPLNLQAPPAQAQAQTPAETQLTPEEMQLIEEILALQEQSPEQEPTLAATLSVNPEAELPPSPPPIDPNAPEWMRWLQMEAQEINLPEYAWVKRLFFYPAILVMGGMGAGKSSFAHWVLRKRIELEKANGKEHLVEAFDLHCAAEHLQGLEVYGAGQKFWEIMPRLKAAKEFIQNRFQQYADIGKAAQEKWARKTYLFEEMTSWAPEAERIVREQQREAEEAAQRMADWGFEGGFKGALTEIRNATEMVGDMLVSAMADSRKSLTGFLFVGHGDTNEALGGKPGLADVRNRTLVKLEIETTADEENGEPRPTGYGILTIPNDPVYKHGKRVKIAPWMRVADWWHYRKSTVEIPAGWAERLAKFEAGERVGNHRQLPLNSEPAIAETSPPPAPAPTPQPTPAPIPPPRPPNPAPQPTGPTIPGNLQNALDVTQLVHLIKELVVRDGLTTPVQPETIQEELTPESEIESLPPLLRHLIRYIIDNRKGFATARTIQQGKLSGLEGHDITSIRSMLTTLANCGYGRLTGEGTDFGLIVDDRFLK